MSAKHRKIAQTHVTAIARALRATKPSKDEDMRQWVMDVNAVRLALEEIDPEHRDWAGFLFRSGKLDNTVLDRDVGIAAKIEEIDRSNRTPGQKTSARYYLRHRSLYTIRNWKTREKKRRKRLAIPQEGDKL